MKKIDAIVLIIRNEWKNEDIINAWNLRCEYTNCMDDEILTNDNGTLEMLFSGRDYPYEDLASAITYGDYKSHDDYLRLNGYYCLVSFDYWDDDDSPVDLEELAEYLIDVGDVDAKEIDSDLLADYFVEEYYEENHREEMLRWIDRITEEETFDLLTEDWDDLYVQLREFSETDY